MKEFDNPHRRFNPLIGEWVLVSPQRDRRPWQGQIEKETPETLASFDPGCYLCPGNGRAGGARNLNYSGTFVFDNDFPALLLNLEEMKVEAQKKADHELFQAEPVAGICRVVCFSPRHDLTLPELSQTEVELVVRTWAEHTNDLAMREEIQYVQVFENKGAMMGCSNPHPHSQIWATSFIPNEPIKELESVKQYRDKTGECMLCSILAHEKSDGRRIIYENEDFAAFVPFWAIWPFEILVIPRRHFGSLMELDQNEIACLADILRQVTLRYDNLFEISFPYSMGFHQSVADGSDHPESHLHAHFYPPLLRSANVRKFMVGFEMLAMPQRDLTPEKAAEKLRSVSSVHYRSGSRL